MPKYITDLHLHSKYSRAVSPSMDLEKMVEWAEKKGINVITPADFTHPVWFNEIKEKLEPQSNGLYQLKKSQSQVNFMLTTEISCIYSKNKKTRRIHLLIIAPNLDTVEKINAKLNTLGKLKSDGRPILGLDAKKLAKIVLDSSPDTMVIPAHIWTPWFSMFGSQSGFDTIEECFDELAPQIFAVETGLSSDPPMNWRISQLDKLSIISSSDAHSLGKMGREATVYELEKLSYKNIISALKQQGGNKNKISYTIEFYPEEGRYHFDGHRKCKVSLSPTETEKKKNICPNCRKKLTIGVLNRVNVLADRDEGYQPKNRPPFKSLVQLQEIIAESIGRGVNTKSVQAEYESMIQKGINEFNILLNLEEEELKKITMTKIVDAIIKVRRGDIVVKPGYDGEYGIVKVFSDKEHKQYDKQSSLF